MQDYTPDGSTFHSTITCPEDGDPRDAASFNTPAEQLADNCAWLNLNKASSTDVATMAGPVTIGPGALIVNGTTTLNGADALNARVTPGAAGAFGRRTQTLTDGAATTTIDCQTDYALVNLTSASNGVTRTLTIATTNSPQVGDRIQIHLLREHDTSGQLEIKFSIITIAKFDAVSDPDTKDNEASIELVYVGAPLLSWRVAKVSGFTVVGS